MQNIILKVDTEFFELNSEDPIVGEVPNFFCFVYLMILYDFVDGTNADQLLIHGSEYLQVYSSSVA